jgi:hypothetical protein
MPRRFISRTTDSPKGVRLFVLATSVAESAYGVFDVYVSVM